MDLLSMPGNVQLMDRTFPGLDAGLQVPGAAGSGSDFALSLQQSQDAVVEKKVEGKSDEKSLVRTADADVAVKNTSPEIASEKHQEGNTETEVNTENTFGNKGSDLSVYGVKSEDENAVTSLSSSVDDSADSVADKRVVTITENPENIFLFLSLMAAESNQSIEMDSEGGLSGNSGLLQTGKADGLLSPQSGQNNMLEIAQPEQQAFVSDGESFSPLIHDSSSGPLKSAMVGDGYQVRTQDLMIDLPLDSEAEPLVLPQQAKVMGVTSGGGGILEAAGFSGMGAKAGNNQENQPATIVPELISITKRSAGADLPVVGEPPVETGEIFKGTGKSTMAGDGSVAVSQTIEEQMAVSAEGKTNLLNQSSREKMIGFSSSSPLREVDEPVMPIRISHELVGRQMVGQKGHDNSAHIVARQTSLVDDKHFSLGDATVKTDMTGTVGHQSSLSFDPGIGQVPGGTEKTLPVTSDDLLNQVTMRLPDRHNSRQVVTIQLQPESLGKVEIKLVMEQQKLTAHFVVQHSEVRDVLLKHVSSLHDALVAKGVEVKQVAVEIAPAEKMIGMSVNIDQHSAGGNLSRDFQQFSPGSEQRHHSFSAQHQGTTEPVKTEEVHTLAGLPSSGLFLQPGSLHIRA